jgi:hypothetical protein
MGAFLFINLLYSQSNPIKLSMKASEKISNQNKQWYLVEIIEKCEPVLRDKSSDLRRVTTWGNMHLVKADSPEEAYAKGLKIGRDSAFIFINANHQEMEWSFVGIGDLLPIYEDIEDGAELMWSDYGDISNKKANRFAVSKDELIANIKKREK